MRIELGKEKDYRNKRILVFYAKFRNSRMINFKS